MLQAIGAERAILATLLKDPNVFFEIDDVVSESDFTNGGSQAIFSLIKDLVLEDRDVKIDTFTLISRAEQKGLSNFLQLTHNGELLEALEATKNSVHTQSIGKHVNALKIASIKRNTIGLLDGLKDDVEGWTGTAIDLKNTVEEKVLRSLNMVESHEDDIERIDTGFEKTINDYAKLNSIVGLNVGFDRWQRDSGGLRNGTVTGVFARAKAGKSQFSAYCAAEIAVKQRIPTLYLDTELQLRFQQMRTAGILSAIPYARIESGAWKSNPAEIALLEKCFKSVKEAPFFYKNIAGRSVNYVIPVIRKFFHKYVKESPDEVPRCLVIYDYIKLMNMDDMKGAQEYQVLGFLLSAIHDVAAQLNIPILALGQLNREAFKTDSEATVAGSDRITHNLDSLTILRQKKPEEIETDGEARGSHIFKTVIARSGPGHDYNDWINVHFDKGSGQFKEDKRNSEVLEALQGQRPVAERLEEMDMAPFAALSEED